MVAGTYDIEVSVPGYDSGYHLAIFALSGGGDIAYGTIEYPNATINMQTRSTIITRQTFGSSGTYRVQQYFQALTVSSPVVNAKGVPNAASIAYARTYTTIKITKIA
jgi:alanine racemase